MTRCAAILVFFLFSAEVPAQPGVADPARRTPTVMAIEKASPAVVNVSTTKLVRVRDPFFPMYAGTRPVDSVGSGAIIHPDGYVVTNSHVVRQAVEDILVSLDVGGAERQHKALLLAEDPQNDLALLKILVEGPFPTVTLGRSDDLLIGEPVIAVGNPFGVGKTVTTGVVSGLGRTVRNEDGVSFEDFIQTDAAINPGNSGGPLLNVHGDMIGVNTAIIRGGEGIGFAIPVGRVKEIVERLIESAVARANLGFRPDAGNGGLVVRSVDPEGAARELAAGDILESVDGRLVRGVFDFATPILGKSPGQKIAVAVRRGGARLTVEITVPLRAEDAFVANRLGLLAADLPPASRARGASGILVTKVLEDGPAARVGVKPGDVISSLDRFEVDSLRTLAEVLQLLPAGASVNVRVTREGRRMAGSITLR
jgi:S1-C subfamily serine protease